MNIKEAIELLSYHSMHHQDCDFVKWSEGFLGQLKPYNGTLNEGDFLELVSIFTVLNEHYLEMPHREQRHRNVI